MGRSSRFSMYAHGVVPRGVLEAFSIPRFPRRMQSSDWRLKCIIAVAGLPHDKNRGARTRRSRCPVGYLPKGIVLLPGISYEWTRPRRRTRNRMKDLGAAGLAVVTPIHGSRTEVWPRNRTRVRRRVSSVLDKNLSPRWLAGTLMPDDKILTTR